MKDATGFYAISGFRVFRVEEFGSSSSCVGCLVRPMSIQAYTHRPHSSSFF